MYCITGPRRMYSTLEDGNSSFSGIVHWLRAGIAYWLRAGLA
jgi:hypothetical protein